MRASRIAVLVAALIVAAWFVLGARQAREIADVTSLIRNANTISPAQAAAASTHLDSAATLNPDRTVVMLRAELDASDNHVARAESELNGVVAAEPDNLDAWFLLAQLEGNNPRAELAAQHHIAHLLPRVGSGH
jgi:thioredoxin-like negative regulator of GroEL